MVRPASPEWGDHIQWTTEYGQVDAVREGVVYIDWHDEYDHGIVPVDDLWWNEGRHVWEVVR